MLLYICILFRGVAMPIIILWFKEEFQFFIMEDSGFSSLTLAVYFLLFSKDRRWLKGAFWLTELVWELHIQQFLKWFQYTYFDIMYVCFREYLALEPFGCIKLYYASFKLHHSCIMANALNSKCIESSVLQGEAQVILNILRNHLKMRKPRILFLDHFIYVLWAVVTKWYE